MEDNTRIVEIEPGVQVRVKASTTDEEARLKYKRSLEAEAAREAAENPDQPKATPIVRPPPVQNKDEDEEQKSFKRDAVKVLTRVASETTRSSGKIAARAAEILGFELPEGLEPAAFKKAISDIIDKTASLYGEEDISTIDPISGNKEVQATDTIGGAVLDMATYAPSIAVGVVNPVAGVGAVMVQDQLTRDPFDDNLFDFIQDNLSEENKKFISDYLATDKTDSEKDRRLKMIGQELILSGAMTAVGKVGVTAFKEAKSITGKAVEEMTKSEAGIYFKKLMERTKANRATIAQIKADKKANLLEDPVAQIELQARSGLRRFFNQTFTSRGYLTEADFAANRQATQNVRARIQRAEDIGNRLTTKVNRIAAQASDIDGGMDKDELLETIQQALTDSDPDFHVSVMLPEEIADEVAEARNLIDTMSEEIIDSGIVDNDIITTITDNLGTYMRRSYRAFEDPGYIPEDADILNAANYITNNILKKKGNVLTAEEAFEQAMGEVDVILRNDKSDVFKHVTLSKKVNYESVLGKKKDIPEPIRKVLGEITDPRENVILTVAKVSQMYEKSHYYKNLLKNGKGKYITTEPKGIYTQPISGTNSILDGMYTSKEMVTAINNQESIFMNYHSDSFLMNTWRNLLVMKGSAQAMKTVGNHVTHLRNFIGGNQFLMANGRLPYSRESVQTFKTLTNKIRKGGDEALSEMYENYLRLGIINTNTKVNEFRDLIDAGFQGDPTMLANALDGIGNSMSRTRAAVETVNNVYMATDDFFKITLYEKELRTLAKAFPEEVIEGIPAERLQKEAARITQNVIPNYDLVPKGIKSLRQLPVGSFFSFPAEVIRTSGHIILQAGKELASGNKTLMLRGGTRAVGFLGASTGFAGLSAMTAQMVGVTDEEGEAYKTLMANDDYSPNPNLIYMRGLDGSVYVSDTTALDSYSYSKDIFENSYHAYREGKMNGEEFTDNIVDGYLAAQKHMFSPFVSEPILTQSVTDMYYAYKNPAGRTPDGKPMFQPEADMWERAAVMIQDGILPAFTPGAVANINNLIDALNENPQTFKLEPKDKQTEIMVNTLGVRFKKLDLEDSLLFAGREYNRKFKEMGNISIDFTMENSDTMFEKYKDLTQKKYELQRSLFDKTNAAMKLGMPKKDVLLALEKSGINKQDIYAATTGKFVPFMIGKSKWAEALEEIHKGDTAAFQKDIQRYSELVKEQLMIPLESYDLIEDDQAVGEGILRDDDKVLERLGFAEGGLVEDPMKRLGMHVRPPMYEVKPYGEVSHRLQNKFLNGQMKMLPINSEDSSITVPTSEDYHRNITMGALNNSRYQREVYAKGGLVTIPNAPEEPDERIDKLTGRPYSEQAGSIMKEEEDRIPFVGGGIANAAKTVAKSIAKSSDEATEQVVKEKGKSFEVLHSSDKDFDEFSDSFGNQGSGAQVYTEGTYTSESPGVAQEYRFSVPARKLLNKFTDEVMEGYTLDEQMKSIRELDLTPKESKLLDALEKEDFLGFDRVPEALRALKRPQNYDITEESGLLEALDNFGVTYKVNINADKNEDFIRWNYYLEDQPEKVKVVAEDVKKRAVEKFSKSAKEEGYDEPWEALSRKDKELIIDLTVDRPIAKNYKALLIGEGRHQPLGKDLAKVLGGGRQVKDTFGIEGVEYVDTIGSSRGGESINYVIYDPKIISIAEKWSLSIPLAAALLDMEDEVSVAEDRQQYKDGGEVEEHSKPLESSDLEGVRKGIQGAVKHLEKLQGSPVTKAQLANFLMADTELRSDIDHKVKWAPNSILNGYRRLRDMGGVTDEELDSIDVVDNIYGAAGSYHTGTKEINIDSKTAYGTTIAHELRHRRSGEGLDEDDIKGDKHSGPFAVGDAEYLNNPLDSLLATSEKEWEMSRRHYRAIHKAPKSKLTDDEVDAEMIDNIRSLKRSNRNLAYPLGSLGIIEKPEDQKLFERGYWKKVEKRLEGKDKDA